MACSLIIFGSISLGFRSLVVLSVEPSTTFLLIPLLSFCLFGTFFVVLVCVVVSCVFVVCRSGLAGGVGCICLFAPELASGVTFVVAALSLGVEFSFGIENLIFVCLAPFSSTSFALVTFVCLLLSPRLGDAALSSAPDRLRRLVDFAMAVGLVLRCVRKRCWRVRPGNFT